MPRDSNGNTQPLGGTIVSTGDPILPSQHNPALVDLYEMMSQSLSRDGQGGMRANLNMNGYRITNVAVGSEPGDAATVGQVANSVPVGVVMDFAGNNAPPNWMLCAGQSLSRAGYPELFSVIGTTFGGSGGNFNIPDCRGRVVAGADSMGGTPANRLGTSGGMSSGSRGGVGGSQTHTLTINEMPSHNHGGATGSPTSHTHSFTINRSNASDSGGTGTVRGGSNLDPLNVTTSNGTNHTHSISSQGGGQAHRNLQPTIIMNKIIKVK